MKKIIKILGLVFLLGLLIASYFYPMFLIVFGAILLVLASAWITRRITRRRQKPFLVPDDIIKDFELAEQEFIDSAGRKEPHEILWNIHKQKGGVEYAEQLKRRTGQFEVKEQGVGIQSPFVQPVRRQDIPNNISAGDSTNKTNINRDKRKPKEGWADFG